MWKQPKFLFKKLSKCNAIINPNNIKYYLIIFKLCRSITGTLALKAFSPPSAVYSEGIMLWVSPNCPYLETTWGSPKTTESERVIPCQLLDVPSPAACNSSHHLSDCNCKRVSEPHLPSHAFPEFPTHQKLWEVLESTELMTRCWTEVNLSRW